MPPEVSSHLTLRWRERDSNYRSLGHGYLELARPALGCDPFRGNTHFSGATSSSTCQRSPATRPLTHLRPSTPWIGTTFRVHGMFYRNSTAWSSDFGTTGRRVSWYSGRCKIRTCSEHRAPVLSIECRRVQRGLTDPDRRDHRSPNLTGGPPPLPHARARSSARARARWRGKNEKHQIPNKAKRAPISGFQRRVRS